MNTLKKISFFICLPYILALIIMAFVWYFCEGEELEDHIPDMEKDQVC